MKGDANKIRRLMDGKVITGFAGRQRRRLRLLERFEAKLKDYPAQRRRAATELAKDWRTDRHCAGSRRCWPWSMPGTRCWSPAHGDVIQPTDSVLGIGSGGNYAVAAARALMAHSDLSAERDRAHGAGDRRRHRHLYEHEHHGGGAGVRDLTPREIVAELDRHIVGQADAKRAVAIAIRNRWRRQQCPRTCGPRSRRKTS